jgi:hypothetical protein
MRPLQNLPKKKITQIRYLASTSTFLQLKTDYTFIHISFKFKKMKTIKFEMVQKSKKKLLPKIDANAKTQSCRYFYMKNVCKFLSLYSFKQ